MATTEDNKQKFVSSGNLDRFAQGFYNKIMQQVDSAGTAGVSSVEFVDPIAKMEILHMKFECIADGYGLFSISASDWAKIPHFTTEEIQDMTSDEISEQTTITIFNRMLSHISESKIMIEAFGKLYMCFRFSMSLIQPSAPDILFLCEHDLDSLRVDYRQYRCFAEAQMIESSTEDSEGMLLKAEAIPFTSIYSDTSSMSSLTIIFEMWNKQYAITNGRQETWGLREQMDDSVYYDRFSTLNDLQDKFCNYVKTFDAETLQAAIYEDNFPLNDFYSGKFVKVGVDAAFIGMVNVERTSDDSAYFRLMTYLASPTNMFNSCNYNVNLYVDIETDADTGVRTAFVSTNEIENLGSHDMSALTYGGYRKRYTDVLRLHEDKVTDDKLPLEGEAPASLSTAIQAMFERLDVSIVNDRINDLWLNQQQP